MHTVGHLIAPAAEDTQNFLVPNATFIVELIAFAIILWVLARFVIPPINRAMTRRQEELRRERDELQEAKDKARASEEEYHAQLAGARHEANQIRQKAEEEGAQIIAEMRQKAQAESDRILANGRSQLVAEKRQVVQQLRREVGGMATTLAGRIVGESLEDDERRSRTVNRFLDEVEDEQSTPAAEAH